MLKRWVMGKPKGNGSALYLLNGAWNKLREMEKEQSIVLQKNMVVQLWAYRVHGKLGFALLNLGKVEPGGSGGGGCGSSGSGSESDSGNSSNSLSDSQCDDGNKDQNSLKDDC